MALILPKHYDPVLDLETTESAIKMLKSGFQEKLARSLHLRRVTAPLFVLSGTGINDDLSGTERAVTFPIKCMDDRKAEVVHSLAKWKRLKLGAYGMERGTGLYTDMNAIRSDEELDNLHSLYVDQWDWELSIGEEERTLDFLKEVVRKIYRAMKEMEQQIYALYPKLAPGLPAEITFIHSEELLQRYPDLTPKEREAAITREYGAVFLIGIGGALSNGEPHDGRAPDYDDWTTPNSDGYNGLNGDILFWDSTLEIPIELSSMGIRVDKEALVRQLELTRNTERLSLAFHRSLLNDEIPLSVGGGIGQSRLCMYLLHKAHVGEVQASIWPEEQAAACAEAGIVLL